MSMTFVEPARCLTDPEFFENHDYHALFTHMRATAPVCWTEVEDLSAFWSVFRHADAIKVLSDTRRFSSEINGVMIPTRGIEHIANEALGTGENILQLDPPLHQKIRVLVAPFFSPAALQALEAKGQRIVLAILLEAARRDECDLVEDVAMRIPMAFIFEVLKIAPEDWGVLTDMTNRSLGSSDPELMIGGDPALTMSNGLREIRRYVFDQAIRRRNVDVVDPIGSLSNGQVDGAPLAKSKVEYNAQQLITAGLETTRSVIAAGTYALLQHPEQFALLNADPSLMNSAIEEMIRWSDPAISVMRTAVTDVEIGGQAIRKGDRVVVWVPSANRDEQVFDRPQTFDITRKPNKHLTFGVGEHSCIGLHLAKMELRMYLTNLIEQFDKIEVTGPVKRVRSNFLGGIKSIPVKFTLRTN